MNPGLQAAVRAGVIDQITAERLAPYLAANGLAPADTADPDDEKLRLVTGFNDIFVTIGVVMFLGALGFIASGWGLAGAGLVSAAASWGLAEFFTRKRRMALPSIVLLVIFVGSMFLAVLGLMQGGGLMAQVPEELTPERTLAAAIAASIAAAAHWRRFHVPITVAAGVGALAAIVVALCNLAMPGLLSAHPVPVFLTIGLAIFALAMWFDTSDLTRQTRRTDIAFWLHLLAAPIIVHPILISVVQENAPLLAAFQVVAVFLCLAVVALVVDRRAILVSSLSYLAYAAGKLIAAAGMEQASLAASTLAVGAVVLLLSAAWRPLRRLFMELLPATLRSRLPAVA